MKRALLLVLASALLSCKMATEQQQDPLQQGIYLSRDHTDGVVKKIVITDSVINYFNSSSLTVPSKVFTYRKVKHVMMDFFFNYTHLSDGTPLEPWVIVKHQWPLKSFPKDASSFYAVTPTTGAKRTDIVTVLYGTGIAEVVVIKGAGGLGALALLDTATYSGVFANFVPMVPGSGQEGDESGVFFVLDHNPNDIVWTGFNDEEKGWGAEQQPFDLTTTAWLKQ